MSSRSDGPTGKSGKGSKGGKSGKGKGGKAKSAPDLHPIDYAVLDTLVDGQHANPHEVLGPHQYDHGVTIRV